MRNDIVIVITARLDSERLPRKVLLPLGDMTALELQVHRARRTGLPIVVSTPETDTELLEYATKLKVDHIIGGDPASVVSQIYHAAKPFHPKVVIRGLPDCPFFDYTSTLKRAQALLKFQAASATRTHHPFGREPLYGADEPAYSWSLVEHMLGIADAFEHEHFGAYVDRHRADLNILYTAPLPFNLYRDVTMPFRLELDTLEDYEMLSRLMPLVGPRATPSQAAWVLTTRPDLARINAHVEERTGPVTSFREYMDEIQASYLNAISLGGDLRFGLKRDATPVYCSSGACFIGFTQHGGDLILPTGDVVRKGKVDCDCGAGRSWH